MNQDFGSYLGSKNNFVSILQMTERLGTLPKVLSKWHQNPNQEPMTLSTLPDTDPLSISAIPEKTKR